MNSQVDKNESNVIAAGVCPKCEGSSWYKEENNEVIHTCLCGYFQVVYSERGGQSITHVQTEAQTTLPKQGTKIATCLSAVISHHPTHVTTKDISDDVGHPTKDVASQLMVLMHKGLLDRVIESRGVAGGSTWKLTNRAVRLLNLK